MILHIFYLLVISSYQPLQSTCNDSTKLALIELWDAIIALNPPPGYDQLMAPRRERLAQYIKGADDVLQKAKNLASKFKDKPLKDQQLQAIVKSCGPIKNPNEDYIDPIFLDKLGAFNEHETIARLLYPPSPPSTLNAFLSDPGNHIYERYYRETDPELAKMRAQVEEKEREILKYFFQSNLLKSKVTHIQRYSMYYPNPELLEIILEELEKKIKETEEDRAYVQERIEMGLAPNKPSIIKKYKLNKLTTEALAEKIKQVETEKKMLIDRSLNFFANSGFFTRWFVQNNFFEDWLGRIIGLFKKHGGDLQQTDKDGKTLLHHALERPFYHYSGGTYAYIPDNHIIQKDLSQIINNTFVSSAILNLVDAAGPLQDNNFNTILHSLQKNPTAANKMKREDIIMKGMIGETIKKERPALYEELIKKEDSDGKTVLEYGPIKSKDFYTIYEQLEDFAKALQHLKNAV